MLAHFDLKQRIFELFLIEKCIEKWIWQKSPDHSMENKFHLWREWVAIRIFYLIICLLTVCPVRQQRNMFLPRKIINKSIIKSKAGVAFPRAIPLTAAVQWSHPTHLDKCQQNTENWVANICFILSSFRLAQITLEILFNLLFRPVSVQWGGRCIRSDGVSVWQINSIEIIFLFVSFNHTIEDRLCDAGGRPGARTFKWIKLLSHVWKITFRSNQVGIKNEAKKQNLLCFARTGDLSIVDSQLALTWVCPWMCAEADCMQRKTTFISGLI